MFELKDFNISLAPQFVREILDYAIIDGVDPKVPAPYQLKQLTVLTYARRYQCATFVETGTFRGATAALMAAQGLRVHTVELAEQLYREAAQRFAGDPRVNCIHGDSATALRELTRQPLDGPILYWLDAHYSGGATARGETDVPVLSELMHIFASRPRRDVILIDDIRCFGVEKDYPRLEFLLDLVGAYLPGHDAVVYNDVLRITPKG